MTSKVKIAVVNASNSDIRSVLERSVKQACEQTKDLAQHFKGDSEIQTCYKVWDYVKKNIRYKEDTTLLQDIKLPSGLLRTKVGDCKSFSLFTIAVLKNLGIESYFTYTSYNGISIPSHVYVTTKSGIILDSVWSNFNSEKKPTYKIFKKV